jgi:hypothetical protein
MFLVICALVSLAIISIPFGCSGNVQVVWMAPGETPPSSGIIVNASTSVGALLYAVDNVYKNGILPTGIFE